MHMGKNMSSPRTRLLDCLVTAGFKVTLLQYYFPDILHYKMCHICIYVLHIFSLLYSTCNSYTCNTCVEHQ